MKFSHLVELQCRVYGRMTTDGHYVLEEVRSDLLERYPQFKVSEPELDFVPLLPSDVEEAENRGLMISWINSMGPSKPMTAHATIYTYVFATQCDSLEEAKNLCLLVEEHMPEKFTTITLRMSAWLDRSPM